jgi:hypothetical protein
MKHTEGIYGIHPVIKKVTFTHKGKMDVHLEDGRIIIIPLSLFPTVKKLKEQERKKYYIADNDTIIFDKADEVIHIEQILGRYEDYRYTG